MEPLAVSTVLFEQVAVEQQRNTIIGDTVSTKAWPKLPKSFDQWKLANEYFTAALSIAEIRTNNLPSIICKHE